MAEADQFNSVFAEKLNAVFFGLCDVWQLQLSVGNALSREHWQRISVGPDAVKTLFQPWLPTGYTDVFTLSLWWSLV